ncbi:hypothetical protein NA57DRAFT_76402 [Rhizodiscina lignyota]|uniref:Heterokaryon incompatibility domain-containing protein n=1 Tax=Rhizodiscina lignyota TaxID=1504668 RepID=A0A9P4ICR8_9PEZI|nr:hypothetical protein NA57DRAFT_76402 [Rhizodiscina lignyota]
MNASVLDFWLGHVILLYASTLIAGIYDAIIVTAVELPISYLLGDYSNKSSFIIRKLGGLLLIWWWCHPCAGAADILADFSKWASHDAPNGPPVATKTSIAHATVFFVSAIWTALDWQHFLRTMICMFKPISHQFVIAVTGMLLPQTAILEHGTATAYWICGMAPYSTCWGALAYIAALRYRSPYVLDVYFLVCFILDITWSRTSIRSRTIGRFCIVMPWSIMKALITLPFANIWVFRQSLKALYWQARHLVRQKWLSSHHKQSKRRMREDFKYRPLQPGQIRLLEVMRNPRNLEIECRLRHVHLSKASEYDAISYTWGAESPTHGVDVDGQWIKVRTNAYELLQDRAVINETRVIWMDCLCINQRDHDEKRLQIPMMPRIYRKAKRTIIWLGNIKYAEQCLSLFRDLVDRPWDFYAPEEIPEAVKAPPKWQKKRPIRFSMVEGLDLRFRALARILEHAWFCRI